MAPEHVPPGWRSAKYGDAMIEADERAGDRLDLPVLSVTKTRGPMLASERFGKVLHSRDISRYRVAHRNVIVADPMLLWDGSIGIQRVVDAGLVSPDYRVYTPSDEADPRFLAYVVRSPTMLPHYQGGARGTNVRRNRIARADFLAIPLALPPLFEQRKIAGILACVDDAVETTMAVIDQLRVVKVAMLRELFQDSWPRTTVRGLIDRHGGEVRTGPFGTVLRADEQDSTGTPLISVREIRDGFIAVVADTPRVPARVVERLPHFVLIAGDIVFARKRAVDRCAVVGDAEEGWLMGSDCIRVRLPSLVDPEFAGFWFRTPEIRRHLLERSVGSTSMVTLSQGTLDSIAIPFPPIDVQRGVVAQLRSVDEATMANQSALDAMTSVRSSLARVLLTGEVRVRPDPDQA